MLKIKDDVDLKELEKFGFEYKDGWYSIVLFKDELRKVEIGIPNGDYIFVEYEPRYIYVELCSAFHVNTLLSYHLDILYDLIQAGLVEKVSD